MLDVIASVIVHAVTVAISPVPLVALVVLMVAGSRVAAGVWASGWFFAVLAGTFAGAVLGGSSAGNFASGSDGAGGVNWFALAVSLFFLWFAVTSLRKIPAPGEVLPEPKWIGGLASMKLTTVFALVVLLMLVNPKNTALYLSMGATIGAAGVGTAPTVVTIVIVAVIGSATAIGFTLVALILGDKAAAFLAVARGWLIQNNPLIMGLLFLLLGASEAGKFLHSL
ncbi:MAG: GAP family protein [Arachnia sp.]